MTSNNGILVSQLWANSSNNAADFSSPARTLTFHPDYVSDVDPIQQEVTD